MDLDYRLHKEVARRWTLSAIDCYKIGCNCSRCTIPEIMETPCKMKYCVLELVKKFGKPVNTVGIIENKEI